MALVRVRVKFGVCLGCGLRYAVESECGVESRPVS